MSEISRRDFAKLAGVTGIGALASSAWAPFAIAQGAAKVVIVGGGAGGATAAHFLKKDAPKLDVTLIETNPIYSSSFFSNLYIGGFRTLESLNHGYGGLRRLGIKVVHDIATDVDASQEDRQDARRPHLCLRQARAVARHRHQVRLHSGLFARGLARSCRTPTTRRPPASGCSSSSSTPCATAAWWSWSRPTIPTAARPAPTSAPA